MLERGQVSILFVEVNFANFCLGDSGKGPSSTGEKSAREGLGLIRSWLA